MNSLKPCFLLLTLCGILISQFPWLIDGRIHGLDGDVPEIIQQVCKNVDDAPKECIQVLTENEKTLHAQDFLQLSLAIFELAVNKSQESQGVFKELLKGKNIPAIEECAHHDYDEVIGLFEKGKDEVDESDFEAAGNDALSAREGGKACDTALNAAHVNTPQLTALNHRTWLLSEIVYISTEKLSNKS